MFYRLFVRLNNFVVRFRHIRVAPGNLLLLLPHCLQRSACPAKVVDDVNACRRCGQCPVGHLLDLKDELGTQCEIAGGGRQALMLAKRTDIHALVVCACPKELSDGIRGAFPKPALAVPNQRPHGPCKDTQVDISTVRSAILEMIEHPV